MPQFNRIAAAPARWAAETEVPDILVSRLPEEDAPKMLTPGAARSGLI